MLGWQPTELWCSPCTVPFVNAFSLRRRHALRRCTHVHGTYNGPFHRGAVSKIQLPFQLFITTLGISWRQCLAKSTSAPQSRLFTGCAFHGPTRYDLFLCQRDAVTGLGDFDGKPIPIVLIAESRCVTVRLVSVTSTVMIRCHNLGME